MLKKFNIANSSNSGKPLTHNGEGNPERSHHMVERATTIPKGSTPKRVETGSLLLSNFREGDIVFSAWKHAAAKADQI